MLTPGKASIALFALLLPALGQPAPLTIPKDDLAAFVDGMFDIQLKRDDAAGAALLLSQNGVPLLSRGYGMADVRAAAPMTDETVIRAGGLTAAVIAVAVMQQVEAGRLDLDVDITRYLDLPLSPRTDGTITLRQLLTHTGGFAGEAAPVEALDLRSFLLAHPAHRAFPAGAVHSFSPYGMALAAYAVQRVAHEDFNEYARRAIFQPLGMDRSTLLQRLPPELLTAASRGYGPSTQDPLPPEPIAPSLPLSTSARDMGRFGAMLLNGGSLDGHRVLSPKSVTTILSRQEAPSTSVIPELPSMALGFHEVWFNGSRYFGLSGDTLAFHCELEVDPARKLVLFLVYNSSGHAGPPGEPSKLTVFARGELIHGIFDRYQPFHPNVATVQPAPEQQRLVTGTWMPAADTGKPVEQRHLLHTSIDPATHALMVDRFVSDRGTIKHWPMLLPNLWQQYPQDRILAIPARNEVPDRLALASDPATELVRVSAP